MKRLVARLTPILHLTRVSTAFAAVGNLWFVILWTRATPEELGSATVERESLWILLPAAAVSAIGLFAYGVCLNDLLDARRDRALRPERPMPSGRVSTQTAVSIVTISLMAAILGATVFGIEATVLTAALAVAILLYNAAGKFVPGVGLVMLGLIYAGHMLVPNVELRFIWPVWLVMTHALVVAGARHVLSRKPPKLSRRAVVAAVAGWVFWSAVLVTMGWIRRGEDNDTWPHWVPMSVVVWIVVLAGLCALWCHRRVAATGVGPRAADKVGRYGALWLTLYGCAWLFGVGHVVEGSIMLGLAVAGFAGMTFLREWYGLLEEPPGYRR